MWCLVVCLVCFFTIIVIPPASSHGVTQNDIDRVAAFVKSHGGYIYPLLEPRLTEHSGWALFFNGTQDDADFERRKGRHGAQKIIKIPRSILLCNTSSTIPSNLVENVIVQWKTNFSFWEPFFNTLPKHIDMLWYWTDEELDRLGNPDLVEHVRGEKDMLKQQFEGLSAKLGVQISFEEFQLAQAWVATRAFNINNWHCLVPFADLPNHDNRGPDAYWRWTKNRRTHEKYFEMRSEAQAIKGNELTIWYLEGMTNEQALTEYGFADINSKFQMMDFLLPLALDNLETKKRIMDRIVLKYEVDIPWVMRFFRVWVATEDELENRHLPPIASSLGTFLFPVSWKRELDAALACVRETQRFRSRSRLLRKEFQYLYDSSISFREKMILAYQIPYDRLVERTSQFCSRLAELLKCTTCKGLRRIWDLRTARNPPKLSVLLAHDLYIGGDAELCKR